MNGLTAAVVLISILLSAGLLYLVGTPFLALKWLAFNQVWVFLIPLAWAIVSAYDFSGNWLTIGPGMARVYPVLRSLAPAQTEWLQPPSSETFCALASADLSLKVARTTSITGSAIARGMWGWA